MTVGHSTQKSPVRTEALESDAPRSVLRRSYARALSSPLLAVAITAVVARFLAVMALGPLREGVFIPDEQQYLDLARFVAQGRGAEAWQPGYGQSLYDTTSTFMRPLTALTWLFGPHQLTGQVLAALFGVLTAVLTWRLATAVVRPSVALLAGLVAALMPSQVLWSSVVLRESMVWTCLVGLGLLLVSAARAQSLVRLGLLLLAMSLVLFGLTHLRTQTALVAALGLAGATLTFRAERRWLLPAGAITVAVLAPWVGGIGPAGYTVVERALPAVATMRASLSLGANTSLVKTTPVSPSEPTASQPPTPADGATGDGRTRELGDNVAGPRARPALPPQTRPGRVLVAGPDGQQYEADSQAVSVRDLPAGVVAVALRPLPWESQTSASMALARFEVLVWAPLYLLALVGLLPAWRHRRVLAYPVLVSVGLVGLAAVTQGNVGSAFRHRGQILWAVAVLAAAGAEWAWTRWRRPA